MAAAEVMFEHGDSEWLSELERIAAGIPEKPAAVRAMTALVVESFLDETDGYQAARARQLLEGFAPARRRRLLRLVGGG